jgi:hypothetical protein
MNLRVMGDKQLALRIEGGEKQFWQIRTALRV